jgi:hypothetical protein
MFGTLVLTLPSAHRGGELRIRHAGREVTVDTSQTETSELSYVAFYADCEHEALPVRQGNRVCLVYNLVQKRGRGRKKRALDRRSFERRMKEYAEEIAAMRTIVGLAPRSRDAAALAARLRAAVERGPG